MECKKCGAPTVEGAIYCGYCGARVDGKKECCSCGQLVNEEFAFCIYCGTRIDGKKVCSNCATVHEGNFCPACGTESVTQKTAKKAQSAKQTNVKTMFSKIFPLDLLNPV